MRDLRVNQSLFQELARKVDSTTVYSIEREMMNEPATSVRYSGDARYIFELLQAVAHSEGLPVRIDAPLPPGVPEAVAGWTARHPETGQPTYIGIVTKGRSLTDQARTLLHELAHVFTPAISRARESDRGNLEIVAEAAVYIVGDQLGFDGLDYSANYVADWSRHDTWDRRLHPERVRALEPQILDTAARLGRAIEREYNARRQYREAA